MTRTSPVMTALGSSDFVRPYGFRASRFFVLERRSFVDRPRQSFFGARFWELHCR